MRITRTATGVATVLMTTALLAGCNKTDESSGDHMTPTPAMSDDSMMGDTMTPTPAMSDDSMMGDAMTPTPAMSDDSMSNDSMMEGN